MRRFRSHLVLHWELLLASTLFLASVYGAVFLILIDAVRHLGWAVASACACFYAMAGLSLPKVVRLKQRPEGAEG